MERSALKIWCTIFPHPDRRKRVCGSEKRSSVVQRNLRRIWYFPANLVKTGRGEAKCWSWAWQKKLRQSSLWSLTGFNWLNYFSYRVSKPNFQFQIAKSYGFEILICRHNRFSWPHPKDGYPIRGHLHIRRSLKGTVAKFCFIKEIVPPIFYGSLFYNHPIPSHMTYIDPKNIELQKA